MMPNTDIPPGTCKTLLLSIILAALTSTSSQALGPHEIAVLVNTNSRASVLIADEFVRLRKVPQQNVIPLSIDESAYKSPSTISREDFTAQIWDPANREIKLRKIDDHILAWVYSVDFPIRVSTATTMSIVGLTFTRNQVPDRRLIQNGHFTSPLFVGSINPTRDGPHPQSLDVYKEWLHDDMPLPSMMLGYVQERGNTPDEIISCLKNGVASDHSFPTGTVYFVKVKDIRSTCREWQFPAVGTQLQSLGIKSTILNSFPVGKDDVMGIMTGSAGVEPKRNKNYLPGAMCEHLTSAAAIFHSQDQTKISAWISAGATASAGTVVEPYSIWTKFPHAEFYVNQGAGCTILESFFLSIRCPLQTLPIGEPLAQPYAPAATVTLTGIPKGTVPENLDVTASLKSDRYFYVKKWVWLIDGRLTTVQQTYRDKDAGTFKLDTSILKDGNHTIRAVACSSGLIAYQSFAEAAFRIIR